MTKVVKSKRTGGPRTEAGKLAASKNALKSGAYSALVVLPGESEADFLELEAQLFNDFQVQGMAESAMAHDLAVLTWKRIRLERLEHRAILDKLAKSPTTDEFRSAGPYIPHGVNRYLDCLDAIDADEVQNYRKRLAQSETFLEKGLSLEALQEMQRDDPSLYDWIMELAKEMGLTGPTPERLKGAYYDSNGTRKPLLNRVLAKLQSEIREVLWVPDHLEEIQAAIPKIRDQRILNLMQLNASKRTFDDLARDFYRTLSELRKQQEWRRKNTVIDVTPSSVADTKNHKTD
jgi:PII-like signaling protein